ncbi:MAG: hypothetical protein EA362_10020 [Saprospirales bacterium]|nr:MAG: hypothetical protein EA362_10020 [Saprospirales bacterium]
MNKLNCIVLLSAMFFVIGLPMTEAQISEGSNVMSQGSQPSFSFTVNNADERLASNEFQSYVRSEFRTRVRRDRRANEWVARDVNVVGIDATKAITIYAKFNEAGGDVAVNLWFEMDGKFLSTAEYPSKRQGIFEFIEKYKAQLRTATIESIISDQENDLRSLERQLNRLQRNKSGYEKDIRDAEKTIEDSKKKIEENKKEQSETESAIERQRQLIEETRRKLRDI